MKIGQRNKTSCYNFKITYGYKTGNTHIIKMTNTCKEVYLPTNPTLIFSQNKSVKRKFNINI